ncbi:MAG: 2Fe-2S iron-sulfur cluster-binding protein [Rhodospirillaceae bacterium]
MAVINVTDRSGRKHVVQGAPGATVMEILRDANLDVEAICGGCCSCATCHVLIDDAWTAKLAPQSEDEKELVEHTGAYKPANSRLSCQIKFTDALDGLSLTVAAED